MVEKRRMHTIIDVDMYERIRRISYELNISSGEVVRRGVDQFLKQCENQEGKGKC